MNTPKKSFVRESSIDTKHCLVCGNDFKIYGKNYVTLAQENVREAVLHIFDILIL